MGVRDRVPCEYFQNNGVTGILMYILKTFILIHFHFCLLKNTDIEYIHISHPLPSRVGVNYSTCTWYLYLSTYLSVLDVLEYLV